ncbi:uncharacterized protein FIESC28_11447 [Fusarium coffeatum]|uniref:Nephrocystin 3-like N-terminal domain-containing protein n=1 Tax=Fusarium coffeatum TaxID=231269 RepID=A0A366QJ71_9HYPO|nr:uncharacterized protein FIESC28_11447 [Fusarium coffeatum]RBR04979.1 hypothetical protein FIESC28_11447 [Fusarium coffeatum]
MDPASAIGVTSAVITFLEFSWKVVRNAKEIYDSADGCSNDNLTRESVARSMQAFSRKLQPPDSSAITPEYEGICNLSSECQSISSEILKIFNSVKIGGDKSKYAAFLAGLKTWRCKKDLIQLEERLTQCGAQLSLELSYLKSEQMTYSLDQIRSLVTDDTSKLQQIQRNVDELRQTAEANLGTDILAQVRDILQRQDAVLDRVCQDRILRSLCPSDMDSRYNQVHLPADETFTWVLDPKQRRKSNCSTKDDESDRPSGYWVSRQRQMQLQSNKKFVDWLAVSDGIFHVSGKLGSGKSTLMKLLYTHPRTRKELEVWSASKKLFMSNFYFWKPGTSSQNSLNGLYRSLLYSILTEYPELIPSVLPGYWDQAKKDRAVIQSPFLISPEIIERSLFMLLKNELFYKSRRLCIFIDGLDEFVGSGQHDYRTLVDILDTWVQDSHKNLKLCVSSREENVFMNRYQEYQRLRLHQMTWYDLRGYTKKNLSHLQNKALPDKLSYEVASKAQGIFLWCTLVVQALRRDIEVDPHNSFAGSSVRESSIMELLDELPTDLEDIFRYILNRLSRRKKRNLYQTLSMLKVSAESPEINPVTLWLIAYSFLDEYNKDAGFALIRESDEGPNGNTASREERMKYALRKLQHESGGLLEAVENTLMGRDEMAWRELGYTSDGPNRPIAISYVHRSVPEILERSEFASERKAMLGSFNAADAIANLSLAHWRFCVGSMPQNPNLFPGLARFVLEISSDKTNFKFLDTLDFLSQGYVCDEAGNCAVPFIYDSDTRRRIIGWVTPNYHTAEENRTHGNFNTLFMALKFRRYDYVLWRMQHRAHGIGSPIKKAMLAAILFRHPVPEHVSGDLEHELFNIGCFADSFSTGFTQLPYNDKNLHVHNVECLTIWRDFLAVNWYFWYLYGSIDRRGFSHWLESFLNRGVLCEFEVFITRSTEKEYATINLGDVEVRMWSDYATDSSEYQKTVQATRIFDSDTVYTLADWLRVIDLPNLDRILFLLEENNSVLSHHCANEESLQDPFTCFLGRACIPPAVPMELGNAYTTLQVILSEAIGG